MSVVMEKGDLFAVEADVIAHGANCSGVMGAGIAKAFRAKFPGMYDVYREECLFGKYVPGDFMPWEENAVMGVNLFTQDDPGPTAEPRAILVSLIGVSQRMTRAYLAHPPVLAIPLIGCGIGGLHFHDLIEIVESVAEIFPEITYKIVYNDDNEDQIPTHMRVDNGS